MFSGEMLQNPGLPFVVLSAIQDGSAKAADLTRQHAEAYEHAIKATKGKPIAGLDLAELSVAPQSFAALRKQLHLPDDTVAVYDLFAVSDKVKPDLRKVAGQYLAAQILWTLDKQNLLASVPLSFKLDLPKGWPNGPDAVGSKLKDTGALAISEQGTEVFKGIKGDWDSLRNAAA